ncbi:MAG: AAA family ATPase [Synergistota bacterium]|nr:AAA family ATPase [Synergistota bacterium]
MAVIFPKIKKITINGFGKIFTSNNFEIDLSGNLNILLGGNGLGKTTLLQCLVYALTGGNDNPEIEEKRPQRWDHNYFKGRIDRDAFVIVDFFLGHNLVKLKRGFTSQRVLECMVFTDGQDNLETMTIDQAVKEYGNYSSISDFSFIVNRLLYLPENRSSLIWDYDAQIRTLMIINDELVTEKKYRELRQLVKKKDSNKRKIHWHIGQIKKETDLHKTSENEHPVEITSAATQETYIQKKKALLERLQNLNEDSKSLYSLIKSKEKDKNAQVDTISKIGDQICEIEADYVQARLFEYDQKSAMIYNQTIKTGICPACGQASDMFKRIIQERLKDGACLVCGEKILKRDKQSTCAESDLETLNSQLHEKLTARNEFDVQIVQAKNRLLEREEEISDIKSQLLTLDHEYPDDLLTAENGLDNTDFDNEVLLTDRTDRYVDLCQEETELETEILLLTKQADDIYDSFISDFQLRYEQLGQIYADLASKFIGTDVTLIYTKSQAKFVNMNYLIPHFNGIDRDSPETCSEAQRFFLDIAFRMSILSFNKNISSADASFICETPENALDASYIDNVVKMFLAYMYRGGNLILTSNLQYQGITHPLVKETKEQNMKIEVFDLLKYGKLSDIQNASHHLKKIRDDILAEIEQ